MLPGWADFGGCQAAKNKALISLVCAASIDALQAT